MSPRRANALTVAGLAGLLSLVALTAPHWARLFRDAPPPAQEIPAQEDAAERRRGSVQIQRTINVRLFFQDPERPGLALEERLVRFDADLSQQVQVVVEELLRGSERGLVSPLPAGTRLLSVFATDAGVAYVDLSLPRPVPEASPQAEGAARPPGGSVGLATPEPSVEEPPRISGSSEELLAVYAVVNSVAGNFPAVRRVQILLDGLPADTLAGHIDLSRPLTPDLTLLIERGIETLHVPDSLALPSPPGQTPSPRDGEAPEVTQGGSG